MTSLERAPQELRLPQENPQKSPEAFLAEYPHFVHVSCITRILQTHVLAYSVILEILWENPRTFLATLTFVFCRRYEFRAILTNLKYRGKTPRQIPEKASRFPGCLGVPFSIQMLITKLSITLSAPLENPDPGLKAQGPGQLKAVIKSKTYKNIIVST